MDFSLMILEVCKYVMFIFLKPTIFFTCRKNNLLDLKSLKIKRFLRPGNK